MKICIDAGHGGSDPGTVGTSPFRVAEKAVALQISLLLEQELEERGHWVVMTRRTDRTLSLLARVRFANRLKADLFASVHANAAASAAVEGMEVYHFPGSREGRRAAVAVLAGLVSAFPRHRNRGVKEANFAVLRETTMPAILVETEFLTHPRQLEFLADPESQKALAEAIAHRIEALSARQRARGTSAGSRRSSRSTARPRGARWQASHRLGRRVRPVTRRSP
jgi:N-acetylmuramoyl-L-alanine amidase